MGDKLGLNILFSKEILDMFGRVLSCEDWQHSTSFWESMNTLMESTMVEDVSQQQKVKFKCLAKKRKRVSKW